MRRANTLIRLEYKTGGPAGCTSWCWEGLRIGNMEMDETGPCLQDGHSRDENCANVS